MYEVNFPMTFNQMTGFTSDNDSFDYSEEDCGRYKWCETGKGVKLPISTQ